MGEKNPNTTFVEASAEERVQEREKLLQMKISELGLKLEGTRMEALVNELYKELDSAGILLKPRVYLTDEWGCPEGVPIIGVPFYLADEKLARIQNEILEGIEGQSDEEFLMYLRHEAGHAFNYAHKLYESEKWRELFGPYSRPYLEEYEPNPFSRKFVRHIAGWYAQKHPDEDFAETFAVWLTPNSNWREVYKEWGCYEKLLYVDMIVREVGATEPQISGEVYDVTSEALDYSIAEYNKLYSPRMVEVPDYFAADLKVIFQKKSPVGEEGNWEPAHDFLSRYRRHITDNISYWTGLNETVVRSLIFRFIGDCRKLDLWIDLDKIQETLVEVTAFATTLCMNRLYKGDFIIK
jgi:hypothetical protein